MFVRREGHPHAAHSSHRHPGIPHHIIQRGNRRQKVFFNDEDRIYDIRLLKKYCDLKGLVIWVYCLMINHLHLIGIPRTESCLSEVMAIVNRKYALRVNLREDWTGCLWQNRFYSCPLDRSSHNRLRPIYRTESGTGENRRASRRLSLVQRSRSRGKFIRPANRAKSAHGRKS